MVSMLVMSDTHGKLPNHLPEVDLIIHCGDYSIHGTMVEAREFIDWLHGLKSKHKILVPGNHDFPMELAETRQELESLYDDVYILVSSGVELEGVRFWGMPYVPLSGFWAFGADEDFIRQEISKVPYNIDVLITHGPPYMILDRVAINANAGSKSLRSELDKRDHLKYHFFGHIHENGSMSSGIHHNVSQSETANYKILTL